jgi:uncharacterized protein (TIGR00369 family)
VSGFSAEPDADNPGWLRWRLADETRYNEAVLGPLLLRAEGADHCRMRLRPRRLHTNNVGNIHGAVTLGLIDIALFAAMHVLRGVGAAGSATVDLSAQFIGAGDPGKHLDCVVEVLRETRRLGFLRGLVVQDETRVAAFSGTIRKPSSPPPAG